MKKAVIAAAAALAGVMVAPVAASAHSASATITCDTGLSAHYIWFDVGNPLNPSTNTVKYSLTVDGTEVSGGLFTLPQTIAHQNSSEGWWADQVIPIPSIQDGASHKVDFYVAWGHDYNTTTSDNQTGGSLTSPKAERTLTCNAPPPTTPPTDTIPTPPPGQTIPNLPPSTIIGSGAPVVVPTTPTVKANGTKARACSAVTAKSYRVRAKQSNTITVKVKTTSKTRPTVKLKGAGVSTKKRASSKGTVTFKVRPKRAGKIRVTASGCAHVASVRVGSAKRAASGTSPSFTG